MDADPNRPMNRREAFALHFSQKLMIAKPNKFDKGKLEVACDFGTAINMADSLIQALEDIRPVVIKDPDKSE